MSYLFDENFALFVTWPADKWMSLPAFSCVTANCSRPVGYIDTSVDILVVRQVANCCVCHDCCAYHLGCAYRSCRLCRCLLYFFFAFVGFVGCFYRNLKFLIVGHCCFGDYVVCSHLRPRGFDFSLQNQMSVFQDLQYYFYTWCKIYFHLFYLLFF